MMAEMGKKKNVKIFSAAGTVNFWLSGQCPTVQ